MKNFTKPPILTHFFALCDSICTTEVDFVTEKKDASNIVMSVFGAYRSTAGEQK